MEIEAHVLGESEYTYLNLLYPNIEDINTPSMLDDFLYMFTWNALRSNLEYCSIIQSPLDTNYELLIPIDGEMYRFKIAGDYREVYRFFVKICTSKVKRVLPEELSNVLKYQKSREGQLHG